MLHHPFESEKLDDLFVLKDSSLAANWQSIYKKYFVHHKLHLVDALKMHWQELENNLDTKSMVQNDVNNMKYEKLLNMQKSHYNNF